MKKILLILLLSLSIIATLKAQFVGFSHGFNASSYSGNLVGASYATGFTNPWAAHSGAGNRPIQLTTGLSFTGYNSGTGGSTTGAAFFSHASASGEDINASIGTTYKQPTAGSPDNYFYTFALIKVNTPGTSTTGDYFLHLATASGAGGLTARLFVKAVTGDANSFQFGLSKGATSSNISTGNLLVGTTYLVAIKYVLKSGTTNDIVSFQVFESGNLPASEPLTGWLTATDNNTATDNTAIASICLRQAGSATANASVTVDGIKVTRIWSETTWANNPISHLSAQNINGRAIINWQLNNNNNQSVVVEKSTDGKTFTTLANIGSLTNTYTDNGITGVNYYRLKITATTGHTYYSEVKQVMGLVASIKIYPNPATNYININAPKLIKTLVVYNNLGKLIKTVEQVNANSYNFSLANLPKAIYSVKIIMEGGETHSSFIKQ